MDGASPTERDRRLAGRQYLAFSSVQSDPNASSVNWLKAELARMAGSLEAGGRLWLYEPATGSVVPTTSPDRLRDWAARHFPVAEFGPARKAGS